MKRRWQGIAIGSLGWITLGAYLLDEYAKHGSLSKFYEHQVAEMPLHHMLMFSMVPVMMAFGYIFDRKLRLERELKGYTDQLEQKAWTTATELTASEEKYKTLFENTGAATVIVEADATISLANNRFEALSGYSREEIESKKRWTEFVAPEDLERMKEQHRLRRGDPEAALKNYEFKFVDRKGEVKNIFLTIDMIPGTTQSIASLTDITEQREAAEEIERNYEVQGVINSVLQISMEQAPLKKQLEQILDILLSIPWIVFQSRGAILLVEDEPEVLVMKAQRGLHEALKSACENVPFGRCICGRAAASGELLFVDRIDERHDNRYEGIVPHGHYCAPILSGGRVLGVLNLYVKEGHKRNEREEAFLHAAANALAGVIERKRYEGGLKNAHDKLLEAYEELSSLDELKTDIISNVSHEIRTPITIVKGCLELADDIDDPGERSRLLGTALDAINRQNRIVEDLLEAVKMNEGRESLKAETVDLVHLSTKIREEFEPLIIKDKLKMEFHVENGLPRVRADFVKLRHIMRNLLTNAVKFNRPGGSIAVRAAEKKDHVEICVSDTGIGIPEDKLDKIFDRLYQIDSGSGRSYGGTGLGLAIAKGLVELHGGKITAESKPGEGSTFCFTLPVYRAE